MAEPLRYVVLRHEQVPDPHFDLMIEYDPVNGVGLFTWRSPIWPIDRDVQLEPLEEHRVEYLDYEGPVSGNRGVVRRVARGTYELEIHPGRQDMTLRFREGPPHPTLVIDPESRCRPVGE